MRQVFLWVLDCIYVDVGLGHLQLHCSPLSKAEVEWNDRGCPNRAFVELPLVGEHERKRAIRKHAGNDEFGVGNVCESIVCRCELFDRRKDEVEEVVPRRNKAQAEPESKSSKDRWDLGKSKSVATAV